MCLYRPSRSRVLCGDGAEILDRRQRRLPVRVHIVSHSNTLSATVFRLLLSGPHTRHVSAPGASQRWPPPSSEWRLRAPPPQAGGHRVPRAPSPPASCDPTSRPPAVGALGHHRRCPPRPATRGRCLRAPPPGPARAGRPRSVP